MFRSLKARATAIALSVTAFAMALPAMAGAVEYKKVLEPIETEFTTVVPLVLVALGLIVGVSFGVKWLLRRFGGHR